MPRYFLELSYKGTQFSGFQVQDNANTVQAEVEKAFQIFFRRQVSLTGSSRTDAGVHALQNFFHFDWEENFAYASLYNLNALLPADIVIKQVYRVAEEAHCRFDAVSRRYRYYIYQRKDPFMQDRGWYYPFPIDAAVLHAAAAFVKTQNDFIAFSKRNTQVNNFRCAIFESRWLQEGDVWVYEVMGNRFLRGMVRALVSTMVKMARSGADTAALESLFAKGMQASADFSAPAQGLFLAEVQYPPEFLQPVDR